ncbi:MAG: hypothetical protein ACRD4Y_15370, partial [Candidatus Acidiferrales bacterium]
MSTQQKTSRPVLGPNPLLLTAAVELIDRAKWSNGAPARSKGMIFHAGMLLAALIALLCWTGPAQAQISVTTQHYDSARTGADTHETVLTPSNVNVTQFGKLFSVPVDGYVYAEPLYMFRVTINGGQHNVVYVATEHDSVYAIDADNPNTVYWHVSFINPPTVTTVDPNSVSAPYDIIPEIGITSTPVIDPVAGTIYVLAKTNENGAFVQRLHALDVTTGAERPGSPVAITASVAGTGDGSVSGNLAFDPQGENNRPSLLLVNGHIVIGWASHNDMSPFHGWILSYNASTLAQDGVYNATPNGGLGGVWMSGMGIAADSSNNIYFSSGNGTFDGNSSTAPNNDFGDSVIKLGQPSGGSFPFLDWFTPFDQSNMASNDLDLGSAGVVILPDQSTGPHQHLLLTAGKSGTIYLLNRDSLGHYNASDNSQVVQTIPGALPGIWGAPAWWNNTAFFSGSGEFGTTGDYLKSYTFDPSTGLFNPVASQQTTAQFTFPGMEPVVSSNATSNGIVWTLQTDQFANTPAGSSILHAYN